MGNTSDLDDGLGIGDEIDDYCAREEKFYELSARERGDDDDDGRDSALSLSTPRDPPPPVPKHLNSLRNEDNARVFHENSIRRVALLNIDAVGWKLRREHYRLTNQRLVSHIIDFADLPPKERILSRIGDNAEIPPLFRVIGNALEVDEAYSYPSGTCDSLFQKSYLRSLGEILMPYQKQLEKICEFVNRLHTESNVFTPALIKVLKGWAMDFLRDHTWALEKLRAQHFEGPELALCNLREHLDNICFVYKILESNIRRRTWQWDDVEATWNVIFVMAQNEALIGHRQLKLAVSLQSRCLDVLLKTMDMIYATGRVPPDVADHFVLYNDRKPDLDLLLCRDFQQVNSILWTDDLVEAILIGAQTRYRLGPEDFPTHSFSKQFDVILEVERHCGRGKGLIETDLMRLVFEKTAKSLTDRLNGLMMKEIHENDSLERLWNDLENVTIGSVLQQYAALIYTPRSTTETFCDAFWLASHERINEENLDKFSWIAAENSFGCKIDRPHSFFIGEDLIAAMNACMKFAIDTYRTVEVLVGIANDRIVISRLCRSKCESRNSFSTTGSQYFEDTCYSITLQRRLRYVVFLLKQIVSNIKEFFIQKVRTVFLTMRTAIREATCVRQLEKESADALFQLRVLVDRVGIRKRVHEAMESYTKIADTLNLSALSNTLTLDYLLECEEKIKATMHMFVIFGKQIDRGAGVKDTVFHALTAKLGYRTQGIGEEHV